MRGQAIRALNDKLIKDVRCALPRLAAEQREIEPLTGGTSMARCAVAAFYRLRFVALCGTLVQGVRVHAASLGWGDAGPQEVMAAAETGAHCLYLLELESIDSSKMGLGCTQLPHGDWQQPEK